MALRHLGAPFFLMSDLSKSPNSPNRRLADRRRLLAHERAFAGWIQAGLVFLAIALITRAVFGPDQSPLAVTAGAALFVIASIAMCALAIAHALRVQRWIVENNVADASSWGMIIIAMLLAAGAISTGILFWLF